MAKPPLADLSDAELDGLSAISLSDREAAAASWRTDTEPGAANLLDATEHRGDA
jgi:hypothetical protein